MTDNGVDLDSHEGGNLADFVEILFGALAMVGVGALIWGFGAALGPARRGASPLPPAMTQTLQQLR